MLNLRRIAMIGGVLAFTSMCLLSCAEILVAPPLENPHDPLATAFVPASSEDIAAKQISDRAIVLTWVNGSKFASAVRIEKRIVALAAAKHGMRPADSSQAYRVIGTLPADSTRFVDTTGVLLGAIYAYRIGAVASHGNIGYSAEIGFELSFPPPSISDASDSARMSVHLGWSDVSGFADGYIVERENGSGVFSEIARTAKGHESYTDIAPDTGRTDRYRVRALTSLNISVPSDPVSLNYTLEVLPGSLFIPGASLGAVSPDGTIIASWVGGNAGEIRLYSVATGALMRTIFTNNSAYYGLAISPNDALIAVAAVDSLRILNLVSGAVVRTFPGFYGNSVFSRNGALLAAANWSTQTILIFDPVTWKAVQ